jgi:hypothetical protein
MDVENRPFVTQTVLISPNNVFSFTYKGYIFRFHSLRSMTTVPSTIYCVGKTPMKSTRFKIIDQRIQQLQVILLHADRE